MKKTIKILLVAVIIITTNFTTQAQMKRAVRADVKQMAQQPAVSNQAIYNAVNTNYQSSKLAQVIGIIKNQSDKDISFSQDLDAANTYRFMVTKVDDRPYQNPDPTAIELEKYLLYGGVDIRNSSSSVKYTIEKLNDKEYKYTVYNMPVNTQYVLVFSPNRNNVADPLGTGVSIDAAMTLENTYALKNNLYNGAKMKITGNAGAVNNQNITINNIGTVN